MKNVVIHCVFDGRKGMGEFSEMGEFCLKEKIPCVIRPFSHAYTEDKEEITRLPAYHLYYQNEYELTFYPGDCPKATLEEIQKNDTKWTLTWPWPFRIVSLVSKLHLA